MRVIRSILTISTILLTVCLAAALNIYSFAEVNSSNTIYFSGNQNITKTISFYRNANVSSATLNFSAINVTALLNLRDGNQYQYYNFDEGSGTTAIDNARGAYNLTLTNGPVYNLTVNRFGYAITFDGSNDFLLRTSYTIPTTKNLSISLWVYPNRFSDAELIRATDDSVTAFIVGTNSSGNPFFYLVDNPGEQNITYSNVPLQLNTWNFITVNYNGTSMSIWTNGTFRSQVSMLDQIVYTLAFANPRIGIGYNTYASNAFFNGTIDELAIINNSLNSSQIADRYNSGDGLPFLTNGSMPVNVTFQVGAIDASNEWNYTNLFNGTNNKTNNFASIINRALSNGCSEGLLSDPNCTINFTFHSDRQGVFRISDFQIVWNESINPNLTINSPSGTSPLLATINITARDDYQVGTCYYNITRGASLEIANTQIADCSQTTAQLSGEGTYTVWVRINDTSGNFNITNQTFIASQSTPGGGGGGGGGGAFYPVQLENGTGQYVPGQCDRVYPPLAEQWPVFQADPTFDNFKILWYRFWNYDLCKSAASIVVI